MERGETSSLCLRRSMDGAYHCVAAKRRYISGMLYLDNFLSIVAEAAGTF